VSCDTSTQQPDGHSPGWVADPRHQLDDHEGQHHYRRDSEHVGKALALAESSAGVSNEPQCEKPT
jgi:hypothetical protein